jgi:flagellar capping protein FliD
MNSKVSGVRRLDMPSSPGQEDLLDDEEESVTGNVNIAHKDATQLAKEREEQARKVKRKFQAIREKLAQSQSRYSRIAPDRRSRP